MKVIVIVLLVLCVSGFSQLDPALQKKLVDQKSGNTTKDTTWVVGGMSNFGFSQIALSNWSGGGNSAVSARGLISMYANYAKGKSSWDNTLDLSYGVVKQGGEDVPWYKNDDRIEFSSKFGHKGKKNWFYSTLLSFRTQFYYGFAGLTDQMAGNYISSFFAPAYKIIAAGFDYKPNKNYTIFLSPATSKMTFVLDDRLSSEGAFGVDPGQRIRSEIGGYLKLGINKEKPFGIDNVNFKSNLTLFSNYVHEPQNIDVNWDAMLNMKINKYMAASVSTNLIYDNDILLPRFESDGVTPIYYRDNKGNPYLDSEGSPIQAKGPIAQFKEVLAISFSYKFL